MGQSDIIKVLEKYKEPLAAKEIADIINDRIQEVIKHLNTLIKYNEVNIIEIDRHKAMQRYGSKRKMRLYYIEVNKK